MHNIAGIEDMELFQAEVDVSDVKPHVEEYQQARNEGAQLRDEICRQLYMI